MHDDECEELHCVNYVNYVCARASSSKICKITIFYIDYGIDDVFNGTAWHRKAATRFDVMEECNSSTNRAEQLMANREYEILRSMRLVNESQSDLCIFRSKHFGGRGPFDSLLFWSKAHFSRTHESLEILRPPKAKFRCCCPICSLTFHLTETIGVDRSHSVW